MAHNEIRMLFESISDSAIMLDRAGRVVDWNRMATALFGYARKDMLGRSLNLLYSQNHPFPKIIQDLATHGRWQTEGETVCKNGSRGFCRTTLTLLDLPNDTSKPVALVLHNDLSAERQQLETLQKKINHAETERDECLQLLRLNSSLLTRNITAITEMEKQLAENELRFHLLAENATDLIARLSPDGTYLYVSPSCKVLLDYTPDELTGTNCWRLVHHDDVAKLKKAFNRRRDNNGHHMLTYRIRRKEGEYRWIESNIRLIRDASCHIIREIQTASRDVTDRILDKKARLRGQQLAHVFRLSTMEEMASGMAHEISQPLAAIVNYTQGCVRYLQKENHDPAQLAEIMNKAVTQAERAGEVIHRLKNFFCKGQLLRTPCKINSLIREAVSLIRSDLTISRTRVEFDLDRGLIPLSADRIQVQQVILNLIQNGMDAMQENDPRQRRINIQTRAANQNTIEVTVTDSGPGFSKDMIHKVFQPFFTTKAHGRGMGLAICRSIIEAHGGEFIIHPNTHQKSWIRFTLPIQTTEETTWNP